jgi:hypothetical protein
MGTLDDIWMTPPQLPCEVIRGIRRKTEAFFSAAPSLDLKYAIDFTWSTSSAVVFATFPGSRRVILQIDPEAPTYDDYMLAEMEDLILRFASPAAVADLVLTAVWASLRDQDMPGRDCQGFLYRVEIDACSYGVPSTLYHATESVHRAAIASRLLSAYGAASDLHAPRPTTTAAASVPDSCRAKLDLENNADAFAHMLDTLNSPSSTREDVPTEAVTSPGQFIDLLNRRCGQLMSRLLAQRYPGWVLMFIQSDSPAWSGPSTVTVHRIEQRALNPERESITVTNGRFGSVVTGHADDPVLGLMLWRCSTTWNLVEYGEPSDAMTPGIINRPLGTSGAIALLAYRSVLAMRDTTPAHICHLEDLLMQISAADFERKIAEDYDCYDPLVHTEMLHPYSYRYMSGTLVEYARYIEDAIAHCYKDPAFSAAMANHILTEKCTGITLA